MDGGFVDDLETLGVSEEEFDAIIDELNADDSEALAWYERAGFPQGLQCVAVHGHVTTRSFIEDWAEEHNIPALDTKHLVWAELILDNMIS